MRLMHDTVLASTCDEVSVSLVSESGSAAVSGV